jgi:hypothetical protein
VAVRLWAACLLTLAIVSCSRKPPDATPEGALRAWLDRMNGQVTDPHAPDPFELLSKHTVEGLQKRADRASRVEGHRVEAREMLAQGRFALRFEPRRFVTTIGGDTATVEVLGDESDAHASVRCVKEGTKNDPRWRVDLALPELAELPHRPD